MNRSPEPAVLGSAARADELMRQAFPLHQSGRVAEAEDLYREILAIAPDHADANYLMGCLARQRGEHDQAVQYVGHALRHKDDEPAFHQTLAECFMEQGLWHEAVRPFEDALRLDPESARNWNHLGIVFVELARLDDALRCFERAVAQAPDLLEAWNNLGNTLCEVGDTERGLQALARVVEFAPDRTDEASCYLFNLNLSTRRSRAEVFAAHQDYDRRFGSGVHGTPARTPADADPERRLRIAYFSPDLHGHAVARFVEPMLAHHDRRAFEVGCYHLGLLRDEVTGRLQGLSDFWVDAPPLDDAALAARIAADGVDVLIDLAGHTPGTRLPVLARKPAPLIATWLGYLGTTGLRAVDYRITDAVSDPPGTEAYHSERLLRLPHAQWCFARPHTGRPVAPLPALQRGHVCFGSMNKSSKLSDEVLDLWARVLQRVPGSRLVIAAVEGDSHRARIRERFTAAGIAADRIEFVGRMPLEAFHALHDRVDLAFDAYPYSGATTTLDALWMGVPTLTRAGDAPISRSTASILATLGLEDFVARTPDEFVECAVRHAGAVPALAALRPQLRGRLQSSILMDGARFVRVLEDSLRAVWRTHCAAWRANSRVAGQS